MAKRFLEISVRAISENADGREMLNKCVTVNAPQPRRGRGLWGVCVCMHLWGTTRGRVVSKGLLGGFALKVYLLLCSASSITATHGNETKCGAKIRNLFIAEVGSKTKST